MAIKSPLHITSLVIALSVEFFGVNSLLSPAEANSLLTPQSWVGENRGDHGSTLESSLAEASNQLPSTRWNQYQPPTDGQGSGVPGRREGGATRNPSCPGSVTALIPESTSGATLKAQPTFFYYVDTPLNNEVEFVLTDDTGKEFTSTFKLKTSKAGIMGVNLSALGNLTPLEIGKYYQWDFTVKCDSNSVDGGINVRGWVKRIALNSQEMSQLEQAAPASRLNIYTQKFLWYDALATLAELRDSNPNNANFTSQWKTLLEDEKLDEILEKPLVPTQVLSALPQTSNPR